MNYLINIKFEKWFSENISVKDTNRPRLKEMVDFARVGDRIYIVDFSRLACNTTDLLKLVEQLQADGIQLVSVKENVDTNTAAGKLILTMFAAIAEFEGANIRER